PPLIDPLSPQGPAPSRVSQVDPFPLAEPVDLTVDSSAAEGGAARGAASGGAEPAGAEPRGAEPASAEPGGAEPEGAEPGAGGPAAGGTGAGGAGATSLGGAGVSGGAGGPGGAGAAGPGGARTRGSGAAGGDEAGDLGAGGTGAGAGGARAGGAGAGGTGAGGAGAGGPGARGAGARGAGAGNSGAGGTVQRRPFFVPPPPTSLPRRGSVLRQVLTCISSCLACWRYSHRSSCSLSGSSSCPRHSHYGTSSFLFVAIFDLDFDAILAAMYAVSTSDEGDCYLCLPPDPGGEAAALGACEAAALGASASAAPGAGEPALSGTVSAQVFHTFTLDSGASRSFFRDRTTLTPLSRPVAVSLADPSGGPVLASFSTVLPCPAAPSGTLSGLYLPSFSTNLVNGVDLQDQGVDQFTPASQRVTHCTCARTGRHLATFTRRPGSSLYTLSTASPPVTASGQAATSSQVFAAASRSGPESAPCSCRLLSHQTLLWHHCLGHPSLPRLRGMASRVLVSGLPRSLPPLPPGPAPTCVPCVEGRQRATPHSSEFPPTEAPLQTLHMDGCRGPVRGSPGPRCPPGGRGRRTEVVARLVSASSTPLSSKAELLRDALRCARLSRGGPRREGPSRGGGAEPGGAESGGAEPGGAEPGGAESGGAEPVGTESGGAEPGSAEPGGAESARVASRSASSRRKLLSPHELREWFARCWSHAAGAGGPPVAPGPEGACPGAVGTGGAAVAAGVGPAGASGAASAGATGGVGAGVGAAGASGAASAGATGGVDAGVGAAVASGAAGAGAAGGVGAGVGPAGGTAGAAGETGAAGPAGVGAVGGGGAAGTGAATGGTGAVPVGTGGPARPRPYFVPLLEQVLSLAPSPGPAPPLECPQPVQSQSPLQPVSPLPAPSPYACPTGGLAERREPASRPVSPVRTTRTSRRALRLRPPAVPGTHQMTLRPSTAPLRVPLPSPPESSLPVLADPASDSLRAASPTVARLLSTVLTDPSFESTAVSALVAELVNFAARCRLDYATRLVAESESVCPPSVGGECALSTDVLEDRQEEFQCFAAALPHLVSTLIAPEGDPDAPDIPTPRSYTEAIEGPYSSHWQVKRPPGSPPVFKARYVARGFIQRQGVDYFQTFSPTPKMTTLRVLLHVAAQRDYELHSLDFSTAFLQGSLHEKIWLRRPLGFTGSFLAGTQWSLRRPVYGLRQAPREWHDTLRTTLAALGFAPSTADPSLFLRTDTSLPPFYIIVYVDDLAFATADTAGLAHVKSELKKRHTCTVLGKPRSYPGLQITRDRAQRTITLTQSHMVQQVLQCFDFTYSSPQATPLSTRHSLSALPSDESVEPSGPYPELVGCLMYLMTCTRPDLAYPLSILARYVAPGRHRPEHMAAAKRVLRYLCTCFALLYWSCDLLFSYLYPTHLLVHSFLILSHSVPLRVPLSSPPASSLANGSDLESDLVRAASPTVTHLLATIVTDPSFESAAASALVAELVDFVAAYGLDYAASLVVYSEFDCPPYVGGECALGTDVFEDRQEDFEFLATAIPHLVVMLLAPEGDAPDIPTPRSYVEAFTGPYSSQWQTAMDTEMASWKSTCTFVDAVPPARANIVDGMWIFRVKRPSGSLPVFKARYVLRGFSQHHVRE
ncbi:unnamed protein product, partial [Closterium sp. NIES-53]